MQKRDGRSRGPSRECLLFLLNAFDADVTEVGVLHALPINPWLGALNPDLVGGFFVGPLKDYETVSWGRADDRPIGATYCLLSVHELFAR